MHRYFDIAAAALCAALALAPLARAQEAAPVSSSLWDQETLTGDWGGLRKRLAEENGIKLSAQEIAETLGNISGGIHIGFIAESRLTGALGVDFDKAFGW